MTPRRTTVIAAALAGLLLLAVAPARAVDAPPVTIESVDGRPVSDGEISGQIGKQHTFATGTADLTPPLVADAGDSQYVAAGTTVQLEGLAGGGQPEYGFAWSHEGATARFSEPAQAATTFDTTTLEGLVEVTLTVTDSGDRTATDTVKLFVYQESTERLLDEAVDAEASVFGLEGSAEGTGRRFPFAVPADAIRLDLELSWQQSYQTGVIDARGYDLTVDDPSDREDANQSGAGFDEPERINIDEPAAGDWAAIVTSSLNVPDTYRVTADAVRRPADPRPAIVTTNPVQFDTLEVQELTASATGGSAPVALAWDLDLDLVFETPGADAVTDFPLGTHLVAVKATDAAGYEVREVVAVRVVEPGTSDERPPFVVVALTDTGINPYHRDFSAADYPDAGVLAVTGDFTRHPSEYLPGYPTGVPALKLDVSGGYLPPGDEAKFAAVPLRTLHWIPGTKIIGAYDGGNSDDRDLLPILDDDYVPDLGEPGPGHGTASASVMAGNLYGYCPTCLLVVVEDINGDHLWPYSQPWIDIVSNSYGPQSNIGGAGLITVFRPMPQAAAERGQLGLYAAGNGNANAFESPMQTYTSELTGPSWVLRVGAAHRANRKPIVGTGKPVDITSWGSGTNPAASHLGTSAVANHGGTSAATPYTAGVFGTTLRAVRQALGDTRSGQRGTGTGVIAEGTPIAGSLYLSDGQLTHAELREAVLKSAEHDTATGGTIVIFPPTAPYTPAQVAVEGYGLAEPATAERATAVLLGGGTPPDRTVEDAFFTADYALRDALYGSWSGGGHNSAAGSGGNDAAASTPSFAGLTKADVSTLAAALQEITARADLSSTVLVAASQAQAADAPTYWLHHRGGCTDGAVPGPYLDLINSAEDDDACGAIGTSGLMGGEIGPWTSAAGHHAPSGVPAGSSVDGIVYLQTDHPADVTVTAAVFAGGRPVGSTSVTASTLGLVDQLAGAWLPVPVELTTTGPIVAGDEITLSISLEGTASWYVGYEDDHASFITLGTGGGGSTPEGELAVTITEPAAGQVIDPTTEPAMAAGGTVTFAPAAPEAARLWLRRDACGGTADPNTRLTRADGPDAGDGCGLIPGASVYGKVLDISDHFPLVEGDLPLALAAGQVEGVLYYDAEGPSPLAAIEVALTTLDGSTPVDIGRQTVQQTVLDPLANDIAFAFSFAVPPERVGTTLTSLTLEVTQREAQGSLFLNLENPASFVDVPEAASGPASGTVEVAVDDPAFASPVLATIGEAAAWGATIDVSGLADGPHTLYARAVQDGATSETASVAFTVQRADEPEPETFTGVQIQLVAAGEAPAIDGWRRAQDMTSDGSWSRWTASFTIPGRGQFELHARGLRKGVEIGRAEPVRFRARGG